jgi:hypothetical protein
MGTEESRGPCTGAPSALEAEPEYERGRPGWLGLSGRMLAASVVVAALGAGAVALASQRVEPLGEAFRDAFVGTQGVYEPATGIVSPDQVAFDIVVKAAHNGEQIFFRYDVPTPLPAFFGQFSVYRDGEWVAVGGSSVGPEPNGLDEDRISMLVGDGSVRGFANQGGWITCHEDLRGHGTADIMPASADNEEVASHPVLGEVYNRSTTLKYIPQSRDAGPEWWDFDGWSAMSADRVDDYVQRHEAGTFLDFWFWRAHNTGPIGYGTNQYVFEYRSGSPGSPPRVMNWDGEARQPEFMFDPDVTGYHAMDWEVIQQQGYGWDDYFYLIDGVNAVPFDPDHAWQEGDTLPRLRLVAPEETGGTIRSAATLVPDGDGWRWQVEMWRAMDTGQRLTDKPMVSGRTYDAAVAVHRLSVGSRWHFVTRPFTIGVDMPADVTAARVDGDRPEWDAIAGTTLTVVYPGQTSWTFITSDDHPGAGEIRNDSMSVLGCHDDPIGLGAANRAIEPRLAGVAVPDTASGGIRAFDPGNAAFVFLVIALLTVGVAVALGRGRKVTGDDTEDPR